MIPRKTPIATEKTSAVKDNISEGPRRWPMMVLTAAINPVFNQQGVNVLATLPNGVKVTLESVIYGICASVMLGAVINRFACMNKIITGDKWIYLFGRILPSFSLILSMTIHLVPEFVSRVKKTTQAQKCIGCDISEGRVRQRIKNALTLLLSIISRTLENSIEKADSMKSRGYGLKDRTSFFVFRFGSRDLKMLITALLLTIAVAIGKFTGNASFIYFPKPEWGQINLYGVIGIAAYFMLCILPIAVELWEGWKWKALKSKI